MDTELIRKAIFEALHPIAPEVMPEDIAPDAPLRDQIDLDSMDFLNFVVALHEKLGVDIPESDYANLSTLSALIEYLGTRVSASVAK